MTVYEYKIVPCTMDGSQKDDLQRALTAHAAEGWRVAHVLQYQATVWLLMEREKKAK